MSHDASADARGGEALAVSARGPAPSSAPPWVGRSIPRVEDAALLTGRGRYLDDLPLQAGALHAAILRSPHGHAEIEAIDVEAARRAPGVAAVLTGEDIAAATRPLLAAVKAPIECWPIAVGRVRYVGEPVALVVAADRYLAEDALDLIDVRYKLLPAIVDPVEALHADAPILHDALGANLISDRSFSYGDPAAAFAAAARRISIDVRYPRNACTPIETYGVVASYEPGEGAYDILANFQGPFSLHPVIARALNVPGNRLRLRTPPDSGGSFGVKQGVFPYMVLIAAAARRVGRPVKWIEDRVEHLAGAVAATNRVTKLDAAVADDGRVLALAFDQIEDCGAYLRAPEPATLYRMHGNMTGPYDIGHVSIRNRVVLTNKTPTGLNRGFGGPQLYFALERLMHRIAADLNLDPLDVIRRNLVPAGAFPYRTATGGLLDSGDYQTAVDIAVADGGLQDLRERRAQARREGRLYGIGFAAVVEPSVSNMGYITTVLTPQERAKAGPKNGAYAVATISVDPVGAVSVKVASTPQGQGHRTVLAQVVADALGLRPEDIRVLTDVDTARDAWSVASGNYSSRFAPAVAGAAALAAERLRTRIAQQAAAQLHAAPDQLVFANGMVAPRNAPAQGVPFSRAASAGHWAPGALPQDAEAALSETVYWTPEELTAPGADDTVNSSLCHGFIFDFCGIEIDRLTGAPRIDRYVTMHDCGRILHPAMVAGQVTGAFAHAVGAALLEEYAYDRDGSFLSGTLADYLIPTIAEIPEPVILHHETPSPFTPLGAKGVGEGNCMSTPVCIANAIADALSCDDIALPVSPSWILARVHGPEAAAPASAPAANAAARKLTGSGEARVKAEQDAIWRMLLDPDQLRAIVPGARAAERISDTRFALDVVLAVGPVSGRYRIEVELQDIQAPEAATLIASAIGALGAGRGLARVRLSPLAGGATLIQYDYEADVSGRVASLGSRLLDGALRMVAAQFFRALAARAQPATPLRAWLSRFLSWLRP